MNTDRSPVTQELQLLGQHCREGEYLTHNDGPALTGSSAMRR